MSLGLEVCDRWGFVSVSDPQWNARLHVHDRLGLFNAETPAGTPQNVQSVQPFSGWVSFGRGAIGRAKAKICIRSLDLLNTHEHHLAFLYSEPCLHSKRAHFVAV